MIEFANYQFRRDDTVLVLMATHVKYWKVKEIVLRLKIIRDKKRLDMKDGSEIRIS